MINKFIFFISTMLFILPSTNATYRDNNINQYYSNNVYESEKQKINNPNVYNPQTRDATNESTNIKLLSLKGQNTTSAVSRYFVTWKDNRGMNCTGFSGDEVIMSTLKMAYILNLEVKYLKAGCDNGNVMEITL